MLILWETKNLGWDQKIFRTLIKMINSIVKFVGNSIVSLFLSNSDSKLAYSPYGFH